MTFQVIHHPNGGPPSPFHIVEVQTGRAVEWVNHFLDREHVRCLPNTTLRSYAMDLLHLVRWWSSVNPTDTVSENALASILPAYVRFQAGQQPRPAAASINRRDRGGVRLARRASRVGTPAGVWLLPLLLVALLPWLWAPGGNESHTIPKDALCAIDIL